MSFTIQQYINVFTNNPQLVIKGFDLIGYGSWRGVYAEPCIYAEESKNSSIKARQMLTTLRLLTNGTEYIGYKGGSYTYSVNDYLHFEPSHKAWTDGRHEELIKEQNPELFYLLTKEE